MNEHKNGSKLCRLGEKLKQPVLLSERLTIGANTRKQKQTGILLGGTPGWGYRAIAKYHGIPPIWVWRLSRGEYQEGLDDSSSDDDDDDDSGDYDSDRTF